MKKMVFSLVVLLLVPLLVSCQGDDDAILAIESVPEFDAITVDRYTDFQMLDLPTEVTVELEDGSTKDVLVAWDQARRDYEEATTGDLVLEGRLIPTGRIVNAQDLTVRIAVTITGVDMLATIRTNPQFTILDEAISVAELEDYFRTEDELTLFAPSNTAFYQFFTSYGFTKDDFLARDDLADILTYHVIERKHEQATLESITPAQLASKEGDFISFEFDENLLINTYASVVESDVEATNGMVHEIDQVLLPEEVASTLTETVIDEDFFDTFSDILLDSDLFTGLLLTEQIDLTGDTQVTLFAPNDDAFDELLETYDVTTEELLEFDRIDEVLLNHLVVERYSLNDLYLNAPTTLTSAAEEELEVTVVEDELLVEGATVSDTVDTVEFAIIHVIDRILITDELEEELELFLRS
ncbi:MAG: fasciclin domain-containing protein [Acholeplasmataceae bacterium]